MSQQIERVILKPHHVGSLVDDHSKPDYIYWGHIECWDDEKVFIRHRDGLIRGMYPDTLRWNKTPIELQTT